MSSPRVEVREGEELQHQPAASEDHPAVVPVALREAELGVEADVAAKSRAGRLGVAV